MCNLKLSEMEETFEEYLKQARWDFAIVAEKYSEDLELRTAIDSFLIAYDQAVSKALTTPDAAGRSKEFYCFDSSKDGGCKSKCEFQCDYCRRICPQ